MNCFLQCMGGPPGRGGWKTRTRHGMALNSAGKAAVFQIQSMHHPILRFEIQGGLGPLKMLKCQICFIFPLIFKISTTHLQNAYERRLQASFHHVFARAIPTSCLRQLQGVYLHSTPVGHPALETPSLWPYRFSSHWSFKTFTTIPLHRPPWWRHHLRHALLHPRAIPRESPPSGPA